jgi:RimJ/RimL family protein N-acetyltransferase
VGEKIYLRPISEDDFAYIQRWFDDPEIRRLTGEVKALRGEEAKEFYERHTSADRVWFVIVLKEDDRVIGEAGLLRIFIPWRNTDMSIIIGERNEWGKGYGTETGHLLLDYAFKRLGMHRVSIGVVGFNGRALRFWEALGFKEEGIQKDGYLCDNQYSDFLMMSLLENDYWGQYKARHARE